MKLRNTIFVAVFSSLLLSGCASAPKNSHSVLSSSARSILANAAVETRVEPPVAFRVHTPAQSGGMMVGMLFGAIGGFTGALVADARARALGEKLVEQTGISDPAPDLAQRLMTVLEHRLQAVAASSPIHLVVETKGWTASSAGLAAHSRIRLLDTRNGSSLAGADCRYSTPKALAPANLDAVLADDAAFVKASLEQAVDACVDYVSQNMLP